jgi:hypothetical protein
LLLLRAWEFHVRFLVLAIIHLLLLRAWVETTAHLVRVAHLDLVVPVVQVAQVAHLDLVVPAALVVQADSLAHRAQVSVAEHQVVHRPEVSQVVRAEAQAVAVVAALAVEPLVRSVRAVLAVRARHVNRSVRNAKSSNSAPMRHHLVVQLFHAATATQFCVCVAVLRSKISPTRLTPQLVS